MSAATDQAGPGVWRRHRTTLVIAAFAVAAVVVVLLVGGRPATTTPLDPDNPGADGARAVARVLDGEGVEVRVVRGADALDQVELDGSTTVLVTSTYFLGRSTTRAPPRRPRRGRAGRRRARARGCWPRSVSTPRAGASRFVTTGPPGCSDSLVAGLDVRVDSGTEYDAPSGCFTGEHGHLVARPRDGVTLLGASQLLTNDQVLRADNAAVALRLLGQRDRLVWYVPEVDDLIGDDGVSLRTLLPDWIPPAPLDRRRDGGRAAAVAGTPPRPAGHRAAARDRQGHRDRPQPRPAVPQVRRPRPCRGGPAPRGALVPGDAAAPARGRDHRRGDAGARRRAAHRPAGRGGPPAARRGRAAACHRRRPDQPGQRPGRTRTRGREIELDPTRPANGWPPSGARSPRPWSARTLPCPACSSRCCAAATC